MPLRGWCFISTHCKVSLEWLTWYEEQLRHDTWLSLPDNVQEQHDLMAPAYDDVEQNHPLHQSRIQHARNTGEYQVPHTPWRVNGSHAISMSLVWRCTQSSLHTGIGCIGWKSTTVPKMSARTAMPTPKCSSPRSRPLLRIYGCMTLGSVWVNACCTTTQTPPFTSIVPMTPTSSPALTSGTLQTNFIVYSTSPSSVQLAPNLRIAI